MMTEQHGDTQQIMERAAPKPSVKEVEAVEASEPSQDISPENKGESAEERYDRLVETGFLHERYSFERWIDFKVKNELITQIFKNIATRDAPINIASVASLIEAEMTSEKDKHSQGAAHLEYSVLPEAHKHSSPIHTNEFAYSERDTESLTARVDIHLKMVEHIEENQPKDAEAYHSLAERKIHEQFRSAQTEVISILEEQKRTLEYKQQVLEHEKHDLKLQGEVLEAIITTLHDELTETKGQLVDRDMQLYDKEVVEHLGAQALEADGFTKAA